MAMAGLVLEPLIDKAPSALRAAALRVGEWLWRMLRCINPEPFYRFIAGVATRLIYRPQYSGFEHLPARGAAILISNHVSYVDGLIIAAACKRSVRFVIDGLIYDLPVVNYFMRHNRAIPILPRRDSVVAALEEISAGLKAGDLICIFPEGQLTYTGSLGRFRPGIESIIKRDPVPIYPIALSGLWGSVFSRKYLKKPLRWLPRGWPKNIRAVCGEAIPPEQATVNHLQKSVLRLKYLAG